jgi:hypothetical protein
MEPAGQDRVFDELRCRLRQGHKDALGDILGLVRVAQHPQRGGIDQVNMPANQLGEGRFGAACGIIPQKLLVGPAVHSSNSTPARANRTENVPPADDNFGPEMPFSTEGRRLQISPRGA